METELPALLAARQQVIPGERFTFHGSRMRMLEVTPEELAAMNAQTDRAATELADMRPDVVATACLVAIMAQGAGHHRVAEREITEVLDREGASAPVISSAGALVAGLGALGARRIGIVTPYTKGLTERVVEYLEAEGIEVADSVSLEVPDNRTVASLDPADLLDHWRRLDLAGCDALVLSACVQMPSLAAIETVERECGLPTISAATATAWALLEALGVAPTAPGAGALLSLPASSRGAA